VTAVVEAPVVAPARPLRLSSATTVACVWVTLGTLGLTAVAFFLVTGYVPPPHADASAAEIASFYADNADRLRAGLLLLFISWAGWGTLVAAICGQLGRIEGGRPVLTNLVMLSGGAGWMFLLLPTIILAVTAYRPERSPELTQTLHDLGWIAAFFPFLPFAMMGAAVAVAIFQDPSPRPVFPRWVAYANVPVRHLRRLDPRPRLGRAARRTGGATRRCVRGSGRYSDRKPGRNGACQAPIPMPPETPRVSPVM
jgi:hypothetical protein